MYLFTSPWLGTIDFHLWHKHARIEKHRSSIVGRKNENCLMTHTVTSLSANLSWWFRVREDELCDGREQQSRRLYFAMGIYMIIARETCLERPWWQYYVAISLETTGFPSMYFLFISSPSSPSVWTSLEEFLFSRQIAIYFSLLRWRIIRAWKLE